jgi:hypothetical protein
MHYTIASNQEPAPWPKTIDHGQRVRDRLVFDTLPSLAGWEIRAAIADIEGNAIIVEAGVLIQGKEALIEFTKAQIAGTPPGQYLADCTVLSPDGDPWVILKDVWTIKAGAVY